MADDNEQQTDGAGAPADSVPSIVSTVPGPSSVPPSTPEPGGSAPVIESTKDASDALTERFLKLSGYKASDILGSSAARRSFVTKNGGKYTLNAKGTELRRLAGPAYPKETE